MPSQEELNNAWRLLDELTDTVNWRLTPDDKRAMDTLRGLLEHRRETKIVAVKSGYLVTVEGYYIYEIEGGLVIDVKKYVGITDLQNCNTLDDVRRLVGDIK